MRASIEDLPIPAFATMPLPPPVTVLMGEDGLWKLWYAHLGICYEWSAFDGEWEEADPPHGLPRRWT